MGIRLIIKSFIIYLMIMVSSFAMANTSEIIDGQLNLSEHDFAQDGPIILKGPWQFYWKELLGPGDQRLEEKASYRQVPNAWMRSEPETGVTNFGYATWVLKMSGMRKATRLAFFLDSFQPAYKVILWQQGETKEFSRDMVKLSSVSTVPTFASLLRR